VQGEDGLVLPGQFGAGRKGGVRGGVGGMGHHHGADVRMAAKGGEQVPGQAKGLGRGGGRGCGKVEHALADHGPHAGCVRGRAVSAAKK
jgi:hypothetical protein